MARITFLCNSSIVKLIDTTTYTVGSETYMVARSIDMVGSVTYTVARSTHMVGAATYTVARSTYMINATE
ncbi:MAG: hypothetical protein ABS920_04185 [Sporosarcina sp.]